MKEASELKTQLESDLKKHKASRDDAKQTLEEAKALRDKEAAAFAKVKADSEANIAAIKKAAAVKQHGPSTRRARRSCVFVSEWSHSRVCDAHCLPRPAPRLDTNMHAMIVMLVA